jgi:hypothetical protein
LVVLRLRRLQGELHLSPNSYPHQNRHRLFKRGLQAILLIHGPPLNHLRAKLLLLAATMLQTTLQKNQRRLKRSALSNVVLPPEEIPMDHIVRVRQARVLRPRIRSPQQVPHGAITNANLDGLTTDRTHKHYTYAHVALGLTLRDLKKSRRSRATRTIPLTTLALSTQSCPRLRGWATKKGRGISPYQMAAVVVLWTRGHFHTSHQN